MPSWRVQCIYGMTPCINEMVMIWCIRHDDIRSATWWCIELSLWYDAYVAWSWISAKDMMLYCHVQKRPIILCFLPIRSVTSTQKGRLSKNPTKIQICARISSRLLPASYLPLRNQWHNYMASTYRATNPIAAPQLVGHGNTTTNWDTKNQGTTQ